MPTAITREALKTRMDAGEDLLVVDVLSPESYQARHLPGAINLPVASLDEEAVRGWARDTKIVVYCANFECQASPMAARQLEALGFTRVWDFEGGLRDWSDAGYPFEGETA